MRKNVKFSIVICAYNVEDYIERAVESIDRQDFKNYEMIIVNDGSTDRTYKKIKLIQSKHKNVLVINNSKNVGLGASRNRGVKKASGEYVLYLDCDDTIYDEKTLTKVEQVIDKQSPDIVYMGVQYIGGSNRLYLPNKENSTKEARLACDMHFAVSSKCFRREFLIKNDITFLTDTYYEDMLYSMKATILATKITYGEFPFYNYYRDREGSIMSTPSLRRCTDMYKIMEHIMRLYVMSFIKNETNSIPQKIDIILDAIKNNKKSPVLPKRNYKFVKEDEGERKNAN